MKISRREFMKYCVSSAAVLGLDASALGRIEKALAANVGPHVLWLSASSCTGCTVSLANLMSPSAPRDVADLLINVINLDYHPNLMGAAGDLAVQTLRNAQAGNYILAVEGGIPSAFNGKACTLWHENGADVTALAAVRELANGSIANLAIGTCAAYGGIPKAGPNPTQVTSLSTAIGKPTINIPGCPTHPDWIVYVVAQLLAGNVPSLDSSGRPTALFSRTVHDQCPRREGEEADEFGTRGCLEELGCKGPSTRADCPNRLWNNRVSTCINANANCVGCTESNFPSGALFRVSTTSTIPAQKTLAVNSAAWSSANQVLTATGTGKIGAQAVVKDAAGALVAATMIKRDGTWAVSRTGLLSVPASVVVSSNGISLNANVSNAPAGKAFAVASAQYSVSTNQITVTGTGVSGALVSIRPTGGTVISAVTIPADGNWTVGVTSPTPVPASIVAECAGVSLTAAVTGLPTGSAFAITSAVWNASTRQLTVAGRAASGGRVTVRSSNGTTLGTPTATSSGNWSLVVSNPSSVPTSVTATYNGQTLNAAVQNAPTATTLKITKAEWKREDRRLRVEGKGPARATVQVFNVSSGVLLAAVVSSSEGTWRITKDRISYVSRVRAESNGQKVEANVAID